MIITNLASIFIRPHQALKGLTPAEMAGIGIEGENKWLGLLDRSAKNNNHL